ncbi:MAG: HIT domain-containing protein [Deltaproteobacteria bacterium]|nr:HIT domain-containing protein [Deltaproteobacteria bacterium]
MKQIWAPWRLEYIKNKKEAGCVFCACVRKKNKKEALILAQEPLSFVILNKYPYTCGHLMVIPLRHVPTLEDLSSEEGLEIFLVIQQVMKILKKVFKPQGFNVGVNVGRAAGAGIEGHVHFHIVPRWSGDSNFMPVIGKTRVLPASLQKIYDQLFPHFQK